MSWSIKIENLSKLYRIGSRKFKADTFCKKIITGLKSFWRKEWGDEVISSKNLAHSEGHIISEDQIRDAPEGHFWALKHLTLEVNEGDRLGIVGQNGSGKSTLLKILSRIVTPTKGHFKYRGRMISLLELGAGFHPDLSGRDNIYLNASLNGMSRKQIKEKFDEIIEFSELGEHIFTPVKRYSSGMYLRLAFSIATHFESEILIIDEVLGVGDSHFQKKCRDKMLEASGKGRTLLFVSHEVEAVRNICNKVMVLSHGNLVTPPLPLAGERGVKVTVNEALQ